MTIIFSELETNAYFLLLLPVPSSSIPDILIYSSTNITLSRQIFTLLNFSRPSQTKFGDIKYHLS